MALRRLYARTTMADRLLVLTLFLISLVLLVLVSLAPPGRRVVISRAGKVVFVAPLGESRQVRIPGPLGETLVGIDGNGVRVVKASCPQRVCMRMGEARAAGDLIACVPNRLLIRIDGLPEGEERGYDLLSR